jgi:DNA polymerase-3 subunit delta
MIIKSYELNKKNLSGHNFYLFYGENEGHKEEAINAIIKNRENINFYFESEILNDIQSFFESLITKSFFDNGKTIVIKKVSDKIKELINDIIEKKLNDIKIILIAGELTKKSKIRNLFEKDKELVCAAFYPDNYQSLNYIVNNFFKEKQIPISREIINLLIERSNGSRLHLKNELLKIENYTASKKKVSFEDIQKLTNLSDNYHMSELVDNCLAKNKNKLKKIINENNFSNEEVISILRIFLYKTKRLYDLKKISYNKNLENVVSNFKPPIFWKDKEIVKQQLSNWKLDKIKSLLIEIQKTEFLVKKNFNNSIEIVLDFIYSKTDSISN